MTPQQHKRLILLTVAVVTTGAAAVVVAGVMTPIDVLAAEDRSGRAENRSASQPATAPAARAESSQEQDLAELRRLCRRDLRPSLAPARQAASPQPQPSVRLSLRLIGTVTEKGHSMAVLQMADGGVTVVGRGESVQDAGQTVTVTDVGAEQVTVSCGGRSQTLRTPPKP